jgi:hypothetical protein
MSDRAVAVAVAISTRRRRALQGALRARRLGATAAQLGGVLPGFFGLFRGCFVS